MKLDVHSRIGKPSAELARITLPPPPSDSQPGNGAHAKDSVHQVLLPYGVGIDTHSKFIQVCVLVQRGSDVVRFEESFTTNWQDLLRAWSWVQTKLCAVRGHEIERSQLRYCIESTGTYHLPVLRAWGGIPSVVNPLLAGQTRRKTDVLDAQLLAHHSITGLWKASFIPTEQTQELRVLWAARREFARFATRSGNRMNNILLRFGHTFGAELGIRSKAGMSVIEDLVEGRMPKIDFVCPTGLPPAMQDIVAQLLVDLQHGMAAARVAEKDTESFVKAREWPIGGGGAPEKNLKGDKLLELLRTVPGVGPTTSLAWLSEVGDPSRFQAVKQVAAFAGCDPSVKVSAGKVTSHVRRAGNERLHSALLYAAQTVLRDRESKLGQYGRGLMGRHKKGGYRKATGALARRIACALWHVHRKGEAYDESGYQFNDRPKLPLLPLSEVFPKRVCVLLSDAGVRNTHDLGNWFYDGKLAGISGFGEASMAQTKAWLTTAITAMRSEKKDYVLFPAKALSYLTKAGVKGKAESNEQTRKNNGRKA